MNKPAFLLIVISTLVMGTGCGGEKGKDPAQSGKQSDAKIEPRSEVAAFTISPGADAQQKAQEAFILAKEGDVIEFAEGKFEFDGTLSISGAKGIKVKGQGIDKTILNFANQTTGKGAEGLHIRGDDLVLEDLTVEDSPGDAIKLQDCNRLTIQRVKTWWSGGPSTENGAYGLYPVLCKDVLIEDCVAEGASDAGIYVGQSERVIVRGCQARKNVAGIEIENCINVDVFDNLAENNTGGILVFSLPGLTLKNGSHCRVLKNQILSNNHPNFAKEGAIVSEVPAGTGLMIMANRNVEVFDNDFKSNNGAGCLIVSFLVTQRKYKDQEYDPFTDGISIHDNRFSDGGTQPQGEFLQAFAQQSGSRLPDIVHDGFLNPALEKTSFSFVNNGEASFVNLDLVALSKEATPSPVMKMDGFDDKIPALEPVELNFE